MQEKSIHTHSSVAYGSGRRAPANSRVITLTVIIACFLLASCAKSDPVAGLNELSYDAALTLRPVADSRLLATKAQQVAVAPSQGPPHPPCPADASTTFYDAKITTPITVCTPLIVGNALEKAFLGEVRVTRFKLTNPAIFQLLADLKNSTVEPPPYVCTSSDGPWPARITAERGCIGTCSPHNHLFVVGVPNNVEFDWYGRFDQHPAGFEFVSSPTETDHQSQGQCNGEPKVGAGQSSR